MDFAVRWSKVLGDLDFGIAGRFGCDREDSTQEDAAVGFGFQGHELDGLTREEIFANKLGLKIRFENAGLA